MEFLKEYTDRGWKLFPVHSIVDGRCTCGKADCGSPGKHPRTVSGAKEATNDLGILENWARTWPECNWGLATGSMSGVIVVDVDVKGGFNGMEAIGQWEEEVANDALPKTLQSVTGSGGRHLFFSYGGSDIKNKVGWLRNVDVRSDGGYVIIPPGTHISGGTYRWDNDKTATIQPLPEFLRKDLLLSKSANVVGDWSGDGKNISLEERLRIGFPEGQRDDGIFKLACSLRSDYLKQPNEGKTIVTSLILQVAAASNFPPEEAMKCVEQAYKQDRSENYAIMARTLGGAGLTNGYHPLNEFGNRDRFLDLYGDDLRYVEEWKQWYTWSDRGWTPVTESWVMGKAEAVVDVLREEADQVDEKNDIKAYAEWIDRTSTVAKMASIIKLATTTDRLRRTIDQFDTVDTDLACANGIVDLRTGKIRPFSRNDMVLRNTEINYNPGADRTVWENFLDTSTQGDLEFKEFLQRSAGYTLTGLANKEKFFTISGPPASGKTSFMDAMLSAMGSYATTISPHIITATRLSSADEYQMAQLVGMRLVAASETKVDAKYNEELIKPLTGDEKLIKARKIYGEPFDYKPKFKLWIATNHDPRTTDKAMERRFLPVPFSHTVPEEERNDGLKLALRTTEREAVLAWMIEGAIKYLADNDLKIAQASVIAKEAYQDKNNLLQVFLTNQLEPNPGGSVTILDMFRAWKEWCEDINARGEIGMLPSFPEKLREQKMEVIEERGKLAVVPGYSVKVMSYHSYVAPQWP